jgi:hypothetical protein
VMYMLQMKKSVKSFLSAQIQMECIHVNNDLAFNNCVTIVELWLKTKPPLLAWRKCIIAKPAGPWSRRTFWL